MPIIDTRTNTLPRHPLYDTDGDQIHAEVRKRFPRITGGYVVTDSSGFPVCGRVVIGAPSVLLLLQEHLKYFPSNGPSISWSNA